MSDIEQTQQAGTIKGIDGAIKNCTNCGAEFDPHLRSGKPIECSGCGVKFLVRILE